MRMRVRARDARRMLLRRLAVPALVLPAVLSISAPASAAGGLAPGGSQTISLPLPSSWAAQADRLGVSVVGLVQSENDCLKPERDAGDTTCEADQGDLAGQLEASVAAGRADDHGNCRVAEGSSRLSLVDPAAQTILKVSGVDCLAVVLTFPDGKDDNVAQSDSISFSVQIVADGPGSGITPGSQSSIGATRNGAAQAAGNAAAANAAGNRGRGTAAVAAPAAGGGAAGNGTTGTVGSSTVGSGTVVGRQTTRVAVGGDSVAVQTRAASTSISGQLFAWGAMFLGVVFVGLAVFLWWGRRRREVSS